MGQLCERWTGDLFVTEPQVVYARKQLVALNLFLLCSKHYCYFMRELLRILWSIG